jgi:hypothetical protein
MARTSCDANGNVLWRLTHAGTTILCAHDTLNRLATKTPPSAASPTASSVARMSEAISGAPLQNLALTTVAPMPHHAGMISRISLRSSGLPA